MTADHSSGGSTTPPLYRLRGVERRYLKGEAEVTALRGVDLDITAGEFVCIEGTERLGQEHAAAAPRRPRHAHRRDGRRWTARSSARPATTCSPGSGQGASASSSSSSTSSRP